MRPEVAAGQREVEQSYLAPRTLGTAANIASNFVGAGIMKKISPLLNTLIPSAIAVKGLSKISPQFANFFKGIFSSGYTADQGLDFIRQRAGISQNIGNDHQVYQPTQEMNRQTALNEFNKKKQHMGEELLQQVQGNYPQYQQNQIQESSVDAAILAALDKVLKM